MKRLFTINDNQDNNIFSPSRIFMWKWNAQQHSWSRRFLSLGQKTRETILDGFYGRNWRVKQKFLPIILRYFGSGPPTPIVALKMQNTIYTKVQFPNSVPVIVNLVLTLNFVYTNRTAPVQRPFLLAGELASPAAEFRVTRVITRMIYVQDLSSGTLILC